MSSTEKSNLEPQHIKTKTKRRDKSDLGPDFVAPDGGWGWAVCLAAGFSMFCVYSPIQQYGIIYRQRMYDLGFDAKQITTILNSELATAAFTGIVNAPLFRRFTFRQLAISGGLLVFVGIFLTAYCNTFMQFFICFSCIYGIGQGVNLSATGLTINTYFKTYRRRATGFAATIMGLGPIILPHACTYFLHIYGMQGTILIVAAIALNTLACGSILQPVLWHVKKPKSSNSENQINKAEEKKLIKPVEEIVEQQPTICKQCAASEEKEEKEAKIVTTTAQSELQPLTPNNQNSNSNNENGELVAPLNTVSPSENVPQSCNCNEKLALLKDRKPLPIIEKINLKVVEVEESAKLTFKQRLFKFFDFDLLTDVTFVNLVQGMSVMMFSELNSSFLMPFILASYGYNNEQISLAISLFATMDIVVRFTAPFALDKTNFGNKVIFATGNIILLTGRVFITIVDSYNVLLVVFVFMGFGKGLRMIMGPLLIPGYVPLKRLPGASGLQLVLNAIFTMSVGPILGVIADYSSYTFTIHFINAMTTISLFLWLLEWLVRRILKRSVDNKDVT